MPLREVTRLTRVAEPSGGLVPYRVGGRWGYADTTGQVVIEPAIRHAVLDAAAVSETVFFTHGFALLAPALVLATLPPAVPGETYRAIILNAKGDVLRVRWSEAALLLPDGSLQRVPRWHVYGQWEWGQLRPAAYSDGFSDGGAVRIVPDARDQASRLYPDSLYYASALLGANRGSRADLPLGDAAYTSWRYSPRTQGLYALTDRQGRLLTGYRFACIDSFHEGRARVVFPQWRATPSPAQLPVDRARRPSFAGSQLNYLDSTGTLLPLPLLTGASVFRHGRAVVQQGEAEKTFAIINTRGRFQLPFQSCHLSDPDEAGFVRVAGGPGPGIRYLPPPDKPGFVRQVFEEAGPFRQGRAWARQGTRIGLLDERGRWVTARGYQQLTAPRQLRSYPDEPAREQEAESRNVYVREDLWPSARQLGIPTRSWPAGVAPLYPPADTAYLVARRRGQYGLVARQSGRAVVPVRYDSVLFNACRGVACLRRGGTAYVVAIATGRELIAAEYGGIDFITPHGRLLYLTRSSPAAWALADTTGQLHTPWLAGTGYPTSHGWLLSHEPQGWTLRDSTGRLGYQSAFAVRQAFATDQWELLQLATRDSQAAGSASHTPYWRLPLPSSWPSMGYVIEEPAQWRFLNAELHEVGRLPHAGTTLLSCGWAYHAGSLLTATGESLPAPAGGTPWLRWYFFDYPRAWHQHGVLPTAQGYRTRGGRKLWE
jgi:hypothetical protein